MKNLIKIIPLLFLAFSLSSCGETASDKEEEVNETVVSPERQNRPLQKEEWTAEEAIEIWVENLEMRLGLSDEVKQRVRTIYTDAYMAKGGSLEDKLQKEGAVQLRKDIATETQDQVLPLLTDDQKSFYQKLL